MSDTRNLLVEIGVEELPHEFCAQAMEDFRRLFTDGLKEERIGHGSVSEFTTPRRIALLIEDVEKRQSDFTEEKRGPSAERAYNPDGSPTKALEGFLNGNRIAHDDAVLRDTKNGKYVFAVRSVKGEDTAKILPRILDKTIRGLKFRKTMKWEGNGFLFARPIRWIVFLFGDRVIPCEVAGVKSGRITYGHRTYTEQSLEIGKPADYEETLAGACVVPDREKRKERVIGEVEKLCSANGLAVHPYGKTLFDVTTDLTEYPHAVLCGFEEHFLQLPPEVLTSEMVEHQRYFPLVDKDSGELAHFFIVISNIRKNRETRAGYERVLRARLEDGAFFYNEDSRHSFDSLLHKLKAVTFHEKLGSMYEKAGRVERISLELGSMLSLGEDVRSAVGSAARLCKNDLTTLMVGEFPHLQGVMGYYYALRAGLSEETALGIREHYQPRSAQDALPSGNVGGIVGIADRLDTITGMFAIGLKPKGSKDPFALRRQVLAIIRIIIHLELHFSMKALIGLSTGLHGMQDPRDIVRDIEEFFLNRTRTIFGEMGFAYDEIDASMAGGPDDIFDAYRRVHALHEYRNNADFQDLLISFKRMTNIVVDGKKPDFSDKLLNEPEERALFDHFTEKREVLVQSIGEKRYPDVYKILSTFKPFVDDFFDNVLVMDENPALRGNRIALLTSIIAVFADVIDFSRIVLPGE